MNYTIKKGCENLTISATLQGARLSRVLLSQLSQAQLNELGERFKYPHVEKLQEDEKTKTQPKQKKRKSKPTSE